MTIRLTCDRRVRGGRQGWAPAHAGRWAASSGIAAIFSSVRWSRVPQAGRGRPRARSADAVGGDDEVHRDVMAGRRDRPRRPYLELVHRRHHDRCAAR